MQTNETNEVRGSAECCKLRVVSSSEDLLFKKVNEKYQTTLQLTLGFVLGSSRSSSSPRTAAYDSTQNLPNETESKA